MHPYELGILYKIRRGRLYLEEASNNLIALCGDKLYQTCRSILIDEFITRDVLERVFIKAIREDHPTQEDASLFEWLRRLAVYECHKYQDESKEAVVTNIQSTPEREKPEHHDLLPYLKELSYIERETLSLRWSGMNYKQIAKMLHTSHSAIRRRGSRGFEKLRNLKKRNEGS